MASEIAVSRPNISFTLDLLKKLSEDDGVANIFYSSFSISAALAMVMLGTRGNTATQIREMLGFSDQAGGGETQTWGQMQMQQQQQNLQQRVMQQTKPQGDEDDVHAKFSKLLKDLNKPDAEYDLSTANRLYGEQTYDFKEDFIAETKKFYNAMLDSVDFLTASEAARIKINSWVEEETKGKIKNLLVPGVVSNMTRMVLVNAIYFKGQWAQKFEKAVTADTEFRINKNETKTVKMMSQKSRFLFTFIPEVKCKMLEMPYKGNEVSMIIILPDDIEDETTGLERLESKLTTEKFQEWIHLMRKTMLKVKIPRFKMTVTYSLNTVLRRMGMVDAFDETLSDFSGMSKSNDLVLSNVVHKAFVDVNEEGTEAAAATAGIITMTSVPLPPPTFIADHPFLFFIYHKPTETVLFTGRYSSPE